MVCPVVTDADVFVRCCEQRVIDARSLPHRVVWGMVYSPCHSTWLVQWRRPGKYVCPDLWDMSCAGHVDCVDGSPESYAVAYQRELQEELGLEAAFETRDAFIAKLSAPICAVAPTLDLGYSKQYLVCPVLGGEARLVREHVRAYLSLWDLPIAIGPGSEPAALAWMTAERIESELIRTNSSAVGLQAVLERCRVVLAELDPQAF